LDYSSVFKNYKINNIKTKKQIIAILALIFPLFVSTQNLVNIPDTITGTSINLTIKDSVKQFYAGFNTATFGYNGRYLGPTIILKKWQNVTLNVNNQLTDTTTTHWHGLHVSPLNDGSPHNLILPNTIWSPSFTVLDKASTFWYHPHLHMKTDLQVTKGAAGMIIIRDSAEASLILPRRYGVDDFPLVIQSKHFNASKQINIGTAYDSTILVNGTRNPYLPVPPQVVRIRLLNASSDRAYNFGLTANKTFNQIGSDGGLFANPVTLTRLILAPGERAEILIDFTGLGGQNINLLSYASELPNGIYGATNPAGMGPGTITGYSGNPLNGTNFNIIQFQVNLVQTANPVTTIPSSLVLATPISPTLSVQSRTLTISPVVMGPSGSVNGPFQFNGAPFNMNINNYTVPLNNIETWVIDNQSAIAHPFHIHDVQFYIIDVNGSIPPINLQGRKDVVLVRAQQTVKFIAKFDDFCNNSIPYMFHCHMLPHEDDGLIGQFVVSCPITVINENNTNTGDFNVYPNPSQQFINVQLNDVTDKITKIELIDLLGKTIYVNNFYENKIQIPVSNLTNGTYFIKVYSNDKVLMRKLFINK